MKKPLLAMAGAAALAVAAIPAASAGQAKVDLCHAEGNGSYHKISVAEAAYAKHIEHGDAKVGEAVPGTDGKIFDETCEVVDAPSNGPEVTPGYSGLTEAAGVRYRGQNSGNEIYLGIPDLGVGGNRIETGYSWSATTYKIAFTFDAATNAVSTSIVDPAGNAKSLSYDFDEKAVGPKCDVASWDTMDINVVDRQDPFNLRFNNVTLNEHSLGDFGAEGWNNWTVSGFDFSKSFTLTGDLVVDGTWTGSERASSRSWSAARPDAPHARQGPARHGSAPLLRAECATDR